MAFSGAQETRLGLYGGSRGLYGSFAGKTPTVTATITGTAITGGVLESEIVTGSQTIIITLASDTWVAAGATFNAQRQAIIDGITSAGVEALGWNAEVRDKEVTTAVVRTSNTVATITLTAAPAYSITADETVTVTVPAAALVTSSGDITGTPTFDVTNETPVVTDTGKPRRGAPRRKRYWWEEDRFYLPPHKKKKPEDEPLPHEAAIEDAKQELAAVRKTKATSKAEYTKLAGSLGNITKSAKALERKIEVAQDVAEVSRQYRALGDRITTYIDRLEDMKQRRLERIRADDEDVMKIIMELD